MTKFTSKDCVSAANALKTWLDSQGLRDGDALSVLLLTTVGYINQIARDYGVDRLEGGEAAGRAILKALKVEN